MAWVYSAGHITYAAPKNVAGGLYDYMLQAGWTLAGASASAGTWDTTGASLVTGNWIVLAAPSSAPFAIHIRIELRADSIRINMAPWVGTDGGWNEGGTSWDVPYTDNREFYVNAASSTQCAFVVNDRTVWAWSKWTPTTVASVQMDFVDANPDTINRDDANSWRDDGYVPGVEVTFSGTVSNNFTYMVESLATTGTTDDTLVLVPKEAVAGETNVTCTATPAEVHHVLYAGWFVRYEIGPSPAFEDDRPALVMVGPRNGRYNGFHDIARIHADTGSGYVNLIDGFLQMPADGGQAYYESAAVAADVVEKGPLGDYSGDSRSEGTASGNWLAESAFVRFDEDVTAVRYRENAGRLNGGFLTGLKSSKQRMGPNFDYAAHGGLVHVWPAASAIT